MKKYLLALIISISFYAQAQIPVAGFYTTLSTSCLTCSTSVSPVCLNTNLSFRDTSKNTPTSWLWNFGDGNTSIVQNPTHSYTVVGSYLISLVATNSNGSDSATFTVNVDSLPHLIFNNNSSDGPAVCRGGSITLGFMGIGPGATYNWTPSGSQNANINVAPNQNTTYTLVATNAFGYSDTASINIHINPLPLTNFSAAPMCLGDSTIFINTSADTSGAAIASFFWSFGDGVSTSHIVNPSLIYSHAGTYTVTLIATTIGGCVDVNNKQVVVLPSATISVNASPNAICFNNTQGVTLTASGGTSYIWSNGDTTTTTIVHPTDTTSYTVIGTDTNTCTVEVIKTINVLPLPNVQATASVDTICAVSNQTVTLNASGANTFVWSSGGSGATTNVTPNATTNYIVTGTDGNGCVNTGNVTVNVNTIQTIFKGNVSYAGNGVTQIVNSGKVYIYDANAVGLTNAVDSANITAGGLFNMGGVPFGDYKIYIVPDTLAYPYLTSTYYDTEYAWDSASVYSFNCGDTVYQSLLLDSAKYNFGLLTFGGTLIADASYTGKTNVLGDPVPNVRVALIENPGAIFLTASYTNAAGRFTFHNIPPTPIGSNYVLYPDIPCFGLDSTYTFNSSVSQLHLDYFVSDSTIYIDSALSAAFNGVKSINKTIVGTELKVYPNPYKNGTNISFELKEKSIVQLEIYNTLGERVATLENTTKETGTYRYSFSARSLGYSTGVYYAKLRIGNTLSVAKLIEVE